MTAKNVLSVVLLTLLGVVLFVAIVALVVRLVIKNMAKYGIIQNRNASGAREQREAGEDNTKKPAATTAADIGKRAVMRTRDGQMAVSRCGKDDIIQDVNGVEWVVDTILMYFLADGSIAAYYSCHKTTGAVFALLKDESPFPGTWPGTFNPIPLKMDNTPVAIPIPPTPDFVICPQPIHHAKAPTRTMPMEDNFPLQANADELFDDFSDDSEPPFSGDEGYDDYPDDSFDQYDGEDYGSYEEDAAVTEPEEAPASVAHDPAIDPSVSGEKPLSNASGKGKTFSILPIVIQRHSQKAETEAAEVEEEPEAGTPEAEQEEAESLTSFVEEEPSKEEEKPVKKNRPTPAPGNRYYEIVYNWQKEHPDGTRMECSDETDLPMSTVHLWWEEELCSSPENAALSDEETCCIVREWQRMHLSDGTISACSAEVGLPEKLVRQFWDGTAGKPIRSHTSNIPPKHNLAQSIQDAATERKDNKHQKDPAVPISGDLLQPSKKTQPMEDEDPEGHKPMFKRRREQEFRRAHGMTPEQSATPVTNGSYILAYRINHPTASRNRCASALGYPFSTVERYWPYQRKRKESSEPKSAEVKSTEAEKEKPAVTPSAPPKPPVAPPRPTTTTIIRSATPPQKPPRYEMLRKALDGTSYEPKTTKDEKLFRDIVKWREDNPRGAANACIGRFGAENSSKIRSWWSFANPGKARVS